MKKLLINLTFVAGSFMSFSQDNDTKFSVNPPQVSVFSMGIKGGFGHSFIVPYQNYAFMPSWNAGITTMYTPCEHLGIGVDVLYSHEGMRITNLNPSADVSVESADVNLNYIRVPVKITHLFGIYDDNFRPKVAIGPTFGYLTNADDFDQYNKYDFGANASLGFSYRLLPAAWLHMDAVYNQSLSDHNRANDENDLNGNVRLEAGILIGF